MLINNESSTINNTGLDAGRFGITMTPQVFKVFYSSLYEDKESAVLREVAANALDAHIAAGVADKPITIILPNAVVPELVISDEGIGMSKEDIIGTYTIYGESTKRTNNDEIGGFGYGAKSPFAISSTFTVESTKDGITTVLVNYLDEEGPKYLISKHEHTGQPSGTTVRVPVTEEGQQRLLCEKIQGGLFLSWSVPPIVKGSTVKDFGIRIYDESIPEIVLYEFTGEYNYSIRKPFEDSAKVLVGPYAYSIPINMLYKVRDLKSFQKLQNIVKFSKNALDKSLACLLRFSIGELELSPSRERIEDTPENFNAISDKLQQLIAKWTFTGTDVPKMVSEGERLVATYGKTYNQLFGIEGLKGDLYAYVDVPKDVLKEVLPEKWQSGFGYMSAMESMTDMLHSNSKYVPDFKALNIDEKLAQHRSSTFRGTYSFRTDSYSVRNTMYVLPEVLCRLTDIDREEVNRTISQDIFNTLNAVQRIGTRYVNPRYSFNADTIVLIPQKQQSKLSRCINNELPGYSDVLVVFTDTPEKDKGILEKLSNFIGKPFTYISEAKLLQDHKSIPVKKTARSKTKASPKTVDLSNETVGFRLTDNSYAMPSMKGKTAETLAAEGKRIYVNMPEGRRRKNSSPTSSGYLEHDILTSTDVVYVSVDLSITYLPEARVFWKNLAAKYPNVTLNMPPETYHYVQHSEKFREYLKSQKDLVAVMQQSVMCRIWHVRDLKLLGLKNPLSQSRIHSRKFLAWLDPTKATPALQCKWDGYASASFPADMVFTKAEIKTLQSLTKKYAKHVVSNY